MHIRFSIFYAVNHYRPPSTLAIHGEGNEPTSYVVPSSYTAAGGCERSGEAEEVGKGTIMRFRSLAVAQSVEEELRLVVMTKIEDDDDGCVGSALWCRRPSSVRTTNE